MGNNTKARLSIMQALLLDKEGDIGSEVQASGFEREHEVTLEMWNAQRPAEAEDSTAEDSAQSSNASDSNSNAEDAEEELPDGSRGINGAAPSDHLDLQAIAGE